MQTTERQKLVDVQDATGKCNILKSAHKWQVKFLALYSANAGTLKNSLPVAMEEVSWHPWPWKRFHGNDLEECIPVKKML